MLKKFLTVLILTTALSCKKEEEVTVLRLGHNHTESNASHLALVHFAEEVREKSGGRLKIEIFPNGVLGDDRSMTEQTQQGLLHIVRVNSAVLENFNRQYSVFSMPYLFSSDEQFRRAVESETMQAIYTGAASRTGLRGLTYQDTGVRNFYLKSGPVVRPEDLAGKKVRVLPSRNSIEMMKLMGAVTTPIPYGEVYTALQQGVIDGAENNVQALTLDKHGEVVKYYSLNGHLRLPDFIVMNEKTFQKLTPEQQIIITEAAKNSTAFHNALWSTNLAESRRKAEDEMGVKFNEVEQELFKERTAVMYEQLRLNNPELYAIAAEFQQY
jgi:tripartite ATP-independent transporter DctP family solute receptor